MAQSFRNRSVDSSRHAMVPRSDVPRSSFGSSTGTKTTFKGGRLIPIYLDEVLPGDSHSVRMTAFARLGTVLYPIMDNLHLESFFFYVPNRLLWENWVKMMGEQTNPTDTTSYLIPEVTSPADGWPVGSIADYMGLPTVGQVIGGGTVTTSSLPLRAYWLIYNEWFRDQNLSNSVVYGTGDGPDASTIGSAEPFKRMKRADYFTTSLPWPMKPSSLDASQAFPWMASSAPYFEPGGQSFGNFRQVGVPVSGIGAVNLTTVASTPVYETGSFATTTFPQSKAFWDNTADNQMYAQADPDGLPNIRVTINNIRTAFQVQKLLERDARGGTRYTELVQSHFGVRNPDSRLQRPEYLGGGSSIINVNPVTQSSATGNTGGTTPLGHLSAQAQVVAQHSFSQAFVEHGWIIGLATVRADLSYYQGVHKMWHRRNKFDFYWPAFAQLGEQGVKGREIFMEGSVLDVSTFGFQERWSEYRTKPGMVTGRFRGTSALTLDAWHLAERFTVAPVLSNAFMEDPTEALLERVQAGGASLRSTHSQIMFDGYFDLRRVRPIPAFSTPGLTDHF